MRMMLLGAALVVIGGIALLNQPAVAADTVHEGYVVRAENNLLTMTDKDGLNKHSHEVIPATEITLDGRKARLDELKNGFWVKVTTTPDMREVTKIEAKTKRGQ
jgi:hypothetical protein